MKNSNVAFILFIICVFGNYFISSSIMFLSTVIFAVAYLIIETIEDK